MKSWVSGSISLLVALIVLMVALNLLKKVPGVGKVAGVAQDLATEGHL